MAIYHFSSQIIGRSKGRSAVAAASYRSGSKIKDERYNITHNYEHKQVDESFIILPNHSPVRFIDRKILWNEVEKFETHKNAQLSREINVALPVELSHSEQKKLVTEFVQTNFIDKGMIGDVSIHRDNPNNPHAHVMLTMRPVNENGFEKKKNRDWNKKELLNEWRKSFADISNKFLKENGIEQRIDHRSLKDQQVDRIPQIHEGMVARSMSEKGIKSDRVLQNEEIKKANEELIDLEKQQYDLERKLLIGEYHQLGDLEIQIASDTQTIQKQLETVEKKKDYLITRKGQLPKLRKEELQNIKKLSPKNKIHAFFMSKKRKNQLNDSIENYNKMKQEDKDYISKLKNYDLQITEYTKEIKEKIQSMAKISEKRQEMGREMSLFKKEKLQQEKKQYKEKRKEQQEQKIQNRGKQKEQKKQKSTERQM